MWAKLDFIDLFADAREVREDRFDGAIGIQDADEFFDVRSSTVVGFGLGIFKAHEVDEGNFIRFLVGVVDESVGFVGFDGLDECLDGFEALP